MNFRAPFELPMTFVALLVGAALSASTSLYAHAAKCGVDLETSGRLFSWEDLPTHESVALPERFTTLLAGNERVRAAAARYEFGRALSFDFSQTQTVGNGWGIQAYFLRRVVAAMFPRAVFRKRAPTGRTKVTLTLYDSVLVKTHLDTDVDMAALKTANPGPELPTKTRARELLGLPTDANIVSLYTSWTHSAVSVDYAAGLLRDGLADVVVYSSQDSSCPPIWELKALRAKSITFLDCETWADRPDPPGKRVIVFNDTRGRLPFMHAAADVVVVLGMANGVEGLHAGRPTFVTESTAKVFNQSRWNKMVSELKRTGGLGTFDTYEGLAARLRAGDYRPPESTLHEDPEIVDRLVRGILRVVDRAVSPGA